MGIPGWRDDFAKAYATASGIPPALRSGTFWIVYLFAIPNGVLLADESAYAEVAQISSAAASFGEQIAIDMAVRPRESRLSIAEVQSAMSVFGCSKDRETPVGRTATRFQATCRWWISMWRASDSAAGTATARSKSARGVLDGYLRNGECMWLAMSAATFVESLLRRGSDADIAEASETVARLAAVPTEPGMRSQRDLAAATARPAGEGGRRRGDIPGPA